MDAKQEPDEAHSPRAGASISATYDYKDLNSNLIYQVVRTEPKGFYQQRLVDGKYLAFGLREGWYIRKGDAYYLMKDIPADPNKLPAGDVKWLDKIEPIFYNLPALIKTIQVGQIPFIVEGEKDGNNLGKFGYVGGTPPGGAGKWRPSYTELFRGCKEVIVIADKDEPGRTHAETIAAKLSDIGVKVKVIEMPDSGKTKVKDFSDWLAAGGTRREFEKIIADSPIWQSPKIEGDSISNQLVDQYGQPFYFNKSKEVASLNEAYWAAAFVTENIILFDPVGREFYRYDAANGLFSELSEHIIKREIANKILQVSRDINEPTLERHRKNYVLSNIVSHLKGAAEKRGAFVKKLPFVHLGNGILYFKDSGEVDFVKFSPTFYSRNQSPIHFIPEAKCERFLKELLYPAVTEEDATLIQKYAGLCILGNNLPQRFLILDGKAGRGKSTLAGVIQKLVGLTNVTELRTRHLAERFELFRYLKKTLLVGVDVAGNFLSQKGRSVIKGLLGGDYFDAEQKCGTGSFQLQGKYCIIITSNSRLQVKLDGDHGAWKRRLLIVRFEAPPPPKKIPNFADILIRDEGSGILNWALEGLAMVLEDIRQYGDIQLGEEQQAKVDALLAESDSIRHFLNDRVVIDESCDLSVEELMNAYAIYCPTKGWNPKPATAIPRELEVLILDIFHISKAHSVRRNGKSVRGYHNVGFKIEEEML